MLFKLSNLKSNLALTLGSLNPAFETIAYKPIVQRRTNFYTQCCMGGEISSSLVNMIKGL